jgi:hypothetical protein
MYLKLDTKVFDSSLWLHCEETGDWDTFAVWVYILGKADSNTDDPGFCAATVKTLVMRTGIKQRRVEQILKMFANPDPLSQDPANEGRRIEFEGNGFRVLNWQKYAAKDHSFKRMRKHRAKKTKDLASASDAVEQSKVTKSKGEKNKAEERTAEEYLQVFNSAVGSRHRKWEHLVSKIVYRLTDSEFIPAREMLLAAPIVFAATEENLKRWLKGPEILLRDGSNARTLKDGTVRGGTDHLLMAYNRLCSGDVKLESKLAIVAARAGVLDYMLESGARYDHPASKEETEAWIEQRQRRTESSTEPEGDGS